ncbi:MAG: aminoacyl-histidine dipeptidase [Bacteroidales bacterium]|nr:aminoacyl-histidine dipeptidase [Bacteroidales bacterium]
MNEQLLTLEPKSVWKNFVELTKIPRPSKKEEKVIEFMRQWGESHGIKVIVDEVGNVIFKKPATPGYENKKGIILQGHLDMVPQKNSDKVHDFEKDPITAYIDGDWVTADGTTLGADNGMGVALAMAVFESNEIAHPPLEALFTVDEETGMSGAFGLKPGLLDGDILINLDSEEEGAICIGCAGGTDANVEFMFDREEPAANSVAYKLIIKGLKGGHSGVDIHLQRGNAAKLMFRFLFEANKQFALQLSGFEIGNMRNAIPREGWAVVSVEKSKAAEFEAMLKEYEESYKKEYKESDEGVTFFAEKMDKADFVIDKATHDALINSIASTPNGVMRMSLSMPGVVEASTNLSIVKLHEDKIEISALIRSSVDSSKKEVEDMFDSLYTLANADKVWFDGQYPGWKPEPKSDIATVMDATYQRMYKKVPDVYAIHAGLECGLLMGVYPNIEAISVGPTIKYPHSPDEKIEISTVAKVWDFLLEVLKDIPEKK